ncbi:MAG TPA: TraR/DksA C4-type zinc finger protein [Bacillota bacterium]|nr:TraR/DksA C4-type zinc finger protein [Bacillota bacterium]
MDRNDIKHFEELLNNEKKKRENSLEDKKMGYEISVKELTGDLSSYDNHPGDMGNETFEAEKNISFKTRDRYLLGEIQIALNKIAEGTYGLCELCRREIEKDRLEIRPYSRLCINCENDMERKDKDEEKGRPIEEQVLYPPFGKSFTDNSVKDSVEFDGEDTWDSLNEYNVRMSDNKFGVEDEETGYVEDVEQIGNNQYKKQLE